MTDRQGVQQMVLSVNIVITLNILDFEGKTFFLRHCTNQNSDYSSSASFNWQILILYFVMEGLHHRL